MKSLSAFFMIASMLCVASCGSGDHEPSDREMRKAIEATFENINANYRDLGRRCERREFSNDPLLAMQCLALCGAGGGKCSLSFEITQFRKLGCEKAEGQPGYVCDFVLGFASDSPFAQGALRQLTGGGNAGQGRFLRNDEGWLYLPNQ
jgi:hypothetical protein